MRAIELYRIGRLVGLFAIAVTGMAQAAQDWHVLVRRCMDSIERQIHCASCSAAWPEVSRCAFGRTPQVEQCLEQVDAATTDKPMAYDRIADVAACLGRK